jgi:hypothetical protein
VVLRKVFGTKTGDVTGDLRKLHSEELRGWWSSRAECDVQGRGEVHARSWCGNLKKGDHLEDLGVDGRIM